MSLKTMQALADLTEAVKALTERLNELEPKILRIDEIQRKKGGRPPLKKNNPYGDTKTHE